MIHIDIETRSEVDLLRHGVYQYAMDPSTQLLCLCWAVDDGPVQSWVPGTRPFPAELALAIESGEQLWAHNAQFERLLFEYVICNDYDCSAPKLEQWRCTATLARAHALPGSLENCARALRLRHQKDKRGSELIQLMSVPPFVHTPELLAEMVSYCEQDVRVEREIHSRLPEVPEGVWAGYWCSERINDRGILVDTEIARAAVPLASEEQLGINDELVALTGGDVAKPRSPKLTQWVYDRLPVEYREIMQDESKKSGLSLDGSRVQELLELEMRVNERCAELLRVIELKSLASKSSVAKFQALLDLADPEDNRVRGAFLYLGASQTGRWSSKGLQVHNLPRASVKGESFDQLKAQLVEGRLRTAVMSALSSLLRPSILAADGKVLVSVDWSAIEARALPWVTADERAEQVLDVFRRGDDIYLVTAATMGPQYDRQIGKVATLSLGYGGAVGAFQSMARAYRVSVADSVAATVVADWRRANPWATAFWNDLEMAMAAAMSAPHQEVPVGRVTYRYDGEHLFCTLPSGRSLMYPWLVREVEETRWGPRMSYTCIKSSRVAAQGAPWPRMRLWGGLLAENITQAVCADLLVDLLLWLDAERPEWPVVMHVHDQVVCEVPAAEASECLADLERSMAVAPWWANDLPLDAEGWVGQRFRK